MRDQVQFRFQFQFSVDVDFISAKRGEKEQREPFKFELMSMLKVKPGFGHNFVVSSLACQAGVSIELTLQLNSNWSIQILPVPH